MHNSQHGEPMAYSLSGSSFTASATPNPTLLVTDCVGCHTATDGSTWQDATTGAPIVFNTSEPDYGATSDGGQIRQGLAAGNFYWVEQDDANGHNVFASDATLNAAPGDAQGCGGNCCHDNLDRAYTGSGALQGRAGCQGCHMVSGTTTLSVKGWHHKDDSGVAVTSADQGWYRFLAGHYTGDGYGVTGIEDADWEHSASSTTHNEYLGYAADKTSTGGMSRLGNTMSGFCTGCHGNFHTQDGTASGATPWLRHPSDTVLPATGEYADYTTYDPLTPVARTSLGGVSGVVTPGTDLVMCLSCHRAHASPYYKMMRWDYSSDTLSTALAGCATCHTRKY
ncbi:MAG: cytochrome c3 family protein [Desulfovibrionaceae bacterium]